MSEKNGRAVKYLMLSGIAAMGLATAVAAHAADNTSRGDRPGRGAMMDRGPGGFGGGCERLQERLAKVDRNLTADRVRDIIAGRLAVSPEQNLKVGKVSEKDGVIDVQIVTKDGSLVKTQSISAKTGLSPDAGKNCEKAAERFKKMREANAGGPDANGPDRRGDHREGRGGRGFGRGGHDRGQGFGPGRGGMRGHGGGGPHEFLNLGVARNAGPGHELNLSVAQVKELAEADLVFANNPRLKVGPVKEKDADTITVDIVTTDNSLVARREVDRRTGRARHAES